MRNALLTSLFAAALASTAPQDAIAQSAQPAPAPKPATQQPTTQQPAPKPAPPATTPAAPAPGAQTTTPKPAAPRPAATPAPSARAGMAIIVTDGGGGTIAGVSVAADGPTMRNAQTNASGQVNFPGLQAGVYRLRFEGESV